MWTCKSNPDPLQQGWLIIADCAIDKLHPDLHKVIGLEEHVTRLAIADFFARRVGMISDGIELLDKALQGKTSRGRSSEVPYIFERSDIFCSRAKLTLTVRVKENSRESAEIFTKENLNRWNVPSSDLMAHIACCVFQHRLRHYLTENKLVAFIADGAILPRKSGASQRPMLSPPAVPFKAPSDSDLRHTVKLEMGMLKPFCRTIAGQANGENNDQVEVTGMAIPMGVTLIAGGGYHGKSTLLRTISAGVYNKIPGDGREFCATVFEAVSVRAEDGRYVSNCNVSAFISNLPVPPGCSTSVDTRNFSTNEASGSTSQAANVAEAIEMEATAMLIDEDVSAANFMARDGRMRALVMDESITPLLYRVNGLFNKYKISSIVVVGGVGDWLDVPHKVILMDRYVTVDATAKANSISRQFSYGHVQYAGRGVVHRLEWDKEGTPVRRRPTLPSLNSFGENLSVALLDGSVMFSIDGDLDEGNNKMQISESTEDTGFVDMSRCEQLMGKKSQLYGCGLCVKWIVEHAKQHPSLGIEELIKDLNGQIMESGLAAVGENATSLVESVGFALLPRRHEVFMALTRIRGIKFEEMPVVEESDEDIAKREEDRRKQELAALWASRR